MNISPKERFLDICHFKRLGRPVYVNHPQFLLEMLYSTGYKRTFKSDANEVAFLLGGIGTGNVSIGARGEFRDWEIFNLLLCKFTSH